MSYPEETLAVVAFSFGLRAKAREPNPCNRRLARAAERIAGHESGNILLLAQWEVAKQLKADGVHVDRVINKSGRGAYLDSDEVWAQALAFLRDHRVTRVIPVAQPFLQIHKIRKLIRESGLPVDRKRIGWVGFDPSPANTQWWTKGPMRLLAYAFMQALGRSAVVRR
jgi:hypothetical protein